MQIAFTNMLPFHSEINITQWKAMEEEDLRASEDHEVVIFTGVLRGEMIPTNKNVGPQRKKNHSDFVLPLAVLRIIIKKGTTLLFTNFLPI